MSRSPLGMAKQNKKLQDKTKKEHISLLTIYFLL